MQSKMLCHRLGCVHPINLQNVLIFYGCPHPVCLLCFNAKQLNFPHDKFVGFKCIVDECQIYDEIHLQITK